MTFKKIIASVLMGATIVGSVFTPTLLDNNNVYAAALPTIEYASNPATTNVDGIKAFVTRMYSVCLNRVPDNSGLDDWANKLINKEATGCSVAYGFVFSQEFTSQNHSNEDFVNYMYEAFFGRSSDEGGFRYWINLLESGASREAVFCGFANSQEFATLCRSFGVVRGYHIAGEDFNRIALINLFVDRLYSVVLNRDCDDLGMADWTIKLNNHEITGCSAAYGFVFSPEFLNRHACDSCYVETLYKALMGRASDNNGKNSWLNILSDGASREEVFRGFAGSMEFNSICSSYGIEVGNISAITGSTHANGSCTICGTNTPTPSTIPATLPNSAPTTAPTVRPTSNPTSSPTIVPTSTPTTRPTTVPSTAPTTVPTTVPTSRPTTTLTPTPAPLNGLVRETFGLFYYVNGVKQLGWQTVNGNTYFFSDNAYTGYNRIDGQRYYFDPETCILRRGWTTINGNLYYFSSTGAIVAGIQTIDGKKYVVDDNGKIATGLYIDPITLNTYYLSPDGGQMLTGWRTINNKRYYFNTSTGAAVDGWQTINGNRYYFSSHVLKTGFVSIDSNYYYFDANGVMQTGWTQIEDGWYYFSPLTGVRFHGWFQEGTTWYFLDKNTGKMQTGWVNDNGTWYYCDNSGAMLTGWQLVGADYYYLDPTNGNMWTNEWVEGKDGYWYYVKTDGSMARSETLTIGGTNYYFDSDGRGPRV